MALGSALALPRRHAELRTVSTLSCQIASPRWPDAVADAREVIEIHVTARSKSKALHRAGDIAHWGAATQSGRSAFGVESFRADRTASHCT